MRPTFQMMATLNMRIFKSLVQFCQCSLSPLCWKKERNFQSEHLHYDAGVPRLLSVFSFDTNGLWFSWLQQIWTRAGTFRSNSAIRLIKYSSTYAPKIIVNMIIVTCCSLMHWRAKRCAKIAECSFGRKYGSLTRSRQCSYVWSSRLLRRDAFPAADSSAALPEPTIMSDESVLALASSWSSSIPLRQSSKLADCEGIKQIFWMPIVWYVMMINNP